MVDFDKLVYGPVMQAFGRALIFTPVASAPGAAPYEVHGDFRREHIAEDVHQNARSGMQAKAGVRMSAFAQEPRQGDLIEESGTVYMIDDVQPDAIGGAWLILKRGRA